jgi:phage terminase large subunit GpA-like protein
MAGSQVGKTEIGNNFLLGSIDMTPGPILFVTSTLTLAKSVSKSRITPSIEAMPTIKAKIRPARERDSGNTTLDKQFDGGFLKMVGSNSPTDLSSTPVRFFFGDEIDRWPYDVGTGKNKEGDPIGLVLKRLATFSNSKTFLASTPLIKGSSRIEREFLTSDQRYYYMPCPVCGDFIKFEWKHIIFDYEDYVLKGDTVYVCVECGAEITEDKKTPMLTNGNWIPENQENGQFPGFHLSGLYSPVGWASWNEIVQEHLDIKKEKESIEKRKVWINTRLGETFKVVIEKMDTNALMLRREKWGDKIDDKICVITCAIDTQDDRLEACCVGWSEGQQCWMPLEYKVFYGQLERKEIWQQLSFYLRTRTFPHMRGQMRISCSVIDLKGHYTQRVYDFVKPLENYHIYAILGSSVRWGPVISQPKRNDKKILLFRVGTDTTKDLFFTRLKNTEKGPGFINFPLTTGYDCVINNDITYFDGLTSETRETIKYHHGFPIYGYVKRAGARNEPLDLAVYGIAALHILCYMAFPNNTVDQMLELLTKKMQGQQLILEKEANVFPQRKRTGRRVVSSGVKI